MDSKQESCMSLLNTLKLMKRELFSGHQVETYIKMLEPVIKLTTVHIIQWIEHKMFEAELLEGDVET